MGVVLIVEDEPLEQEFLKTMVEEEIEPEDMVILCNNGYDAVRKAKEYRPNVILMDVLIPEKDGLSTIEDIRKFLTDTVIIILSAYSEFSYAQKAISLGVSDYLLKPIKPREFQQSFRKNWALSKKMEPAVISKQATEPVESEYFLEEAIKYIENHFKEKLTLEMVASYIFMNPQYFSRVFKKETGVTYTDYVNSLRIKHACHLLETTNYPAYRISGECGFTDPSYFNRVFFKEMNMTPMTYKKKMAMSKHEQH